MPKGKRINASGCVASESVGYRSSESVGYSSPHHLAVLDIMDSCY